MVAMATEFKLINNGVGYKTVNLPDVIGTKILLENAIVKRSGKLIGKLRAGNVFNQYFFSGKKIMFSDEVSFFSKSEITEEALYQIINDYSDMVKINDKTGTYNYVMFGIKNGVSKNFNIDEIYPKISEMYELKDLKILKNWSWNFTLKYKKFGLKSNQIMIDALFDYDLDLFEKRGILYINKYKVNMEDIYNHYVVFQSKEYSDEKINTELHNLLLYYKNVNKGFYSDIENKIKELKAEMPEIKDFISEYSFI